jgi:hypothetical protein
VVHITKHFLLLLLFLFHLRTAFETLLLLSHFKFTKNLLSYCFVIIYRFFGILICMTWVISGKRARLVDQLERVFQTTSVGDYSRCQIKFLQFLPVLQVLNRDKCTNFNSKIITIVTASSKSYSPTFSFLLYMCRNKFSSRHRQWHPEAVKYFPLKAIR